MKFSEYRTQTPRTLSKLDTQVLDSVHMCLGFGSELEELSAALIKKDIVNIAEELTDICWYISNYLNIWNLNSEFIIEGTNEILHTTAINWNQLDLLFHDITISISKLQDFDKKLLAYRKPVSDIDRLIAIEGLIIHVDDAFCELGMDAEQHMQNNIDKLRVRYPEKFTEEAAINRNLDKERKELEK